MASENYNSLRGRKQLIRSQRVRVELDFQPSQADAEAAGLRQLGKHHVQVISSKSKRPLNTEGKIYSVGYDSLLPVLNKPAVILGEMRHFKIFLFSSFSHFYLSRFPREPW